MTQALGNTWSNDCGSLREDGLTYVAIDTPGKVIQPPIVAKTPKSGMQGFNHLVLGRLLCPIKYVAKFDEDPVGWVFSFAFSSANHFCFSFLQKLNDGQKSVTAADLPLFLYEDDSYDLADLDKGLCCGRLLVRVGKSYALTFIILTYCFRLGVTFSHLHLRLFELHRELAAQNQVKQS